MRKPTLSASVRRGLDHWNPVMDILLSTHDDSELQERTPKELKDMQAAHDYILKLLVWSSLRVSEKPNARRHDRNPRHS